MNLQKTLDKLTPDINEVTQWAESEYEKYFADYFKGEVELYNKMKTTKSTILDDELVWILTELPLELFAVTEQLSKLKTAEEVIKLSIKKRQREYIKSAEGSEAKKKEEAVAFTAEDQLLVTVYEGITERVSRQMSFSKELIMAAKKIFDARRADGIPLSDINIDPNRLPEYKA